MTKEQIIVAGWFALLGLVVLLGVVAANMARRHESQADEKLINRLRKNGGI